MSVESHADEVFWTLSLLATGYSVRPTPRPLTGFDRPCAYLPEGTEVAVRYSRSGGRGATPWIAGGFLRRRMRPVVSVPREVMHSRRDTDSVLGNLACAGVTDMTIADGESGCLTDVLEHVESLLGTPAFRRAGIRSVRVGCAFGDGSVERSAAMLRACDAVWAKARDERVDVSLLVRQAPSFRALVGWERGLRAAGNRLPVRVTIPDVSPARVLSHYLPVGGERAGSTAPAPVLCMLRYASAIASDRGSELSAVHIAPFGSPRTARWLDRIADGRFVIGGDAASGYRVELLDSGRSRALVSGT